MIHDYAIRLLLRGRGAGNVVKRLPSGFHPHAYPGVIARSAATWQSRRRSKRGAPKYVRPRCKPPMSLRAKRGNPVTEAKPVRPRMSTPQTNPLCHCERSAAIPQPKQSRRVDGCSQSSRFPLVLSLSKDSRNDRLKWVPVTNIPSLSRRQSLATIKTVGYKNRRLKKKTRTPHPTPIPPPRRRERARARAQCPQHQHSHTNKAHQ